MKKILSVVIISLILSTVLITQVYAIPSVSPMLVELHNRSSFEVTNRSDKVKQFKIDLKDFDHNFNLLKYGSTENSLDLSIHPHKFTLEPDETQKVRVIPEQKRHKTKTRWAMVVVKEIKGNEHKGKMEIGYSLAVQVFQYAHNLTSKIVITGLTKNFVKIKNTGNVPEKISGKVEVRGRDGKTKQVYGFEKVTVFPGHSKKISIEVNYKKQGVLLALIPRKNRIVAAQKVLK